MRRTGVVWMMGLGAMLTLSCRSGESGIQESTCSPAGHWLAQEERVGGDCLPDRAPEESVVLDVEGLDMTEGSRVWRFDLTRGDGRLESCSGTPSENQCRLEMTCEGDINEERVDYVLTLDLTPSGALSGSSILTLSGTPADECRARFGLRGERVSPLELEERE